MRQEIQSDRVQVPLHTGTLAYLLPLSINVVLAKSGPMESARMEMNATMSIGSPVSKECIKAVSRVRLSVTF